MITLTTCCKREVTRKFEMEYPDGPVGIPTSVPVCEGCLDERPDTFEACDHCGEFAWVTKTELGDYCGVCAGVTI